MSEQAAGGAVSESFAEHVREFHRSLPVEEKQLLEQVFSLAEAATAMMNAPAEEVAGYGVADYYLKLRGLQGEAARHKLEGLQTGALPGDVSDFFLKFGAIKLLHP
jgi:hypothetical protein